ncbi:MAG: hypothetical protein M3P95_11590, partial [Actinomycetota bacterium]|nr:hypothetical protein [Actinomycetota bacterium]
APSRRRIALLVVAVVAAVAVLGGAVAAGVLFAVRSGGVAGAPVPDPGPRTDGSSAASPAARSVDDVVPEITAFVEQERGLRFTTPAEVRLLPDDEFQAALTRAQERDADPAALAEDEATFTALGLLPPGSDLDAELDALLAAGVLGFYDPHTDELYVRGDAATPAVRSTIAHELVHALQDQAFDLDRPEYDQRDDELALGFSGLVEGDAVVVQEAYERESMTPQERRQAQEPPGDLTPLLDAPPALLQLLTFPYGAGPGLVRTVRGERGQEGLDALFREPPATSEQLLHPEAFLAGEPPVAVPLPGADGPAVDSGVLGELGLALVLAGGGPSPALTSPAAEGWAGDAYVTWREGGTTCTRATVATDTAADGAELRAALDALAEDADEGRRFEVLGSGPVTFTACAGGATA